MKVSAIITAKGGNQSIPDKNLIDINGRPVISYNILAAKNAKLVDDVYVTTECPKIKDVALLYECNVIDRPKELALPDSDHGDTIVHAVDQVDTDIVVILIGNTVMTNSSLIDEAVEKLMSNDCDSVMSMWKAQDDHPYRAMIIEDGLVKTAGIGPIGINSNRQSYPEIYYHDQGVWVIRVPIKRSTVASPWWWLGDRCIPIIRPWITGRDIHGDIDIWISEKWTLV
jgi:CMP-N-acetylneuraminic acid synthetase